MKLTISTNVDDAMGSVRAIDRQAKFAHMRALNDIGFQARRDLQGEMRRVFDRPTPYVLNSLHVERATKDKLEVAIEPRYFGGKGIDPQNVLRPEVFGGARKAKRYEVALRRIGALGPGQYAVPGSACELDAYGNVKGSFIVRLLSYLQAFGEQGYRANAKASTIKRLAKRTKSPGGFKRIGGVEYFVSHGPGTWFGKGSWKNGQQQRLPAGIWARSGTHGSNVKPVILFVRAPAYRTRLDPVKVAEQTVAKGYAALYDYHLQRALETAR